MHNQVVRHRKLRDLLFDLSQNAISDLYHYCAGGSDCCCRSFVIGTGLVICTSSLLFLFLFIVGCMLVLGNKKALLEFHCHFITFDIDFIKVASLQIHYKGNRLFPPSVWMPIVD